MSVPVDVWRTRTKRIGSCDLSQILYAPFKKKYLDIHRVDFDLSQLVCFLVCQDSGLAWVDIESLRFRTFLKSAIIFGAVSWSSPSRARHQRSGILMYSLFIITQFDAPALLFPSFNVILHCGLGNRVEEETTQGVALFCSTSDPEFITFHVSQYGGALISVHMFQEANVLFTDGMISGHVVKNFNAFLKSIAATQVRCSE